MTVPVATYLSLVCQKYLRHPFGSLKIQKACVFKYSVLEPLFNDWRFLSGVHAEMS